MYKSYLNTFMQQFSSFQPILLLKKIYLRKTMFYRVLKALSHFEQTPDTKIMRGWDKDTDNVMMLENGYDFMGFSGFVSTNIPPSCCS